MGVDFEGCATGERKRSKKQGREGGLGGVKERNPHPSLFLLLLLGSRTFTTGEDKTNNSRQSSKLCQPTFYWSRPDKAATAVKKMKKNKVCLLQDFSAGAKTTT